MDTEPYISTVDDLDKFLEEMDTEITEPVTPKKSNKVSHLYVQIFLTNRKREVLIVKNNFQTMKKSRKRLQKCTNQIGKGDGTPNFELVRPPDDNYFQLEVIQSKSFKQSHAGREITYRAKLKNPSEDVPLNNLLTHLYALFETILQETKREYGDAGVMRIYISHPKLEKSIIIPPTYLGYLNSQKILDYIDTVLAVLVKYQLMMN